MFEKFTKKIVDTTKDSVKQEVQNTLPELFRAFAVGLLMVAAVQILAPKKDTSTVYITNNYYPRVKNIGYNEGKKED